MNSPKRPCFLTRPLPQRVHFSSSGSSGCIDLRVPSTRRRVVWQSGYAEHARNGPNLPALMTISLPQLWQYSIFVSPGAASGTAGDRS